jgi:tetratricopeptide (TPR) repeat protein
VDPRDQTGFGHDAPSRTFDETVVGGEDYEREAVPHPTGTKVGRYVILQRVGQGGMGVVYAAFDPELDRKVALKILHPDKATGRKSGAARARLLREAQAIAKVSHPNVISVFDTGTFGTSVFVAMEFVDGVTLTQWQAAQRDTAAIVAMYAQAGEGLAAAHDAGIVHRDFKPDNVLIADGHPRVLDFGLARTEGAHAGDRVVIEEPRGGLADEPMRTTVSTAAMGTTGGLDGLTMDGAVVGTPRFMAPEQHAGETVDARSDQYSFCVALFGALYRHDAFDGDTIERLALAKRKGSIRVASHEIRVSAHVAAAVRRGLSVSPADRWPDMHALVAALRFDADAVRRRRWQTAGVVAVVLTAAAGGVAIARKPDDACDGATAFATAWDDARRSTISDALATVDAPFAAQATTSTIAALDAYATEWIAGYDEACATAARKVESAALFDRRMRCLGQRKQSFSALVDVFGVPDAAVLERAPTAAAALPSTGACSNTEFLLAAIEPPPEELRAQVDELRGRLAHVAALREAGRLDDARGIVEEIVASAIALGHAPLVAEAHGRHANLLEGIGEYAAAEEEAHRALRVALAAAHDEVATHAAHELAGVVGDRLARPAEGLRWIDVARGLAERMSFDERARARFDLTEGNIHYRMADYDAAQASYERGAAIIERHEGPGAPALASWWMNLGNVFYRTGRKDESLAAFERSVAIAEANNGPRHPNTALVYFGLANALMAHGRWDEAEARLGAAADVFRDALGRGSHLLTATTCNRGAVAIGRARFEEALAHFEACAAATERAIGRDHPDFALALYNLARVHLELGRIPEARAEIDACLAIRRASLGADTPDVLAARALAAEVRAAEGDREGAVADLERLLVDVVGSDLPAVELAATQFEYVALAWEIRGPGDELRALAQSARRTLAEDGAASARSLAEVDAWLWAHPP